MSHRLMSSQQKEEKEKVITTIYNPRIRHKTYVISNPTKEQKEKFSKMREALNLCLNEADKTNKGNIYEYSMHSLKINEDKTNNTTEKITTYKCQKVTPNNQCSCSNQSFSPAKKENPLSSSSERYASSTVRLPGVKSTLFSNSPIQKKRTLAIRLPFRKSYSDKCLSKLSINDIRKEIGNSRDIVRKFWLKANAIEGCDAISIISNCNEEDPLKTKLRGVDPKERKCNAELAVTSENSFDIPGNKPFELKSSQVENAEMIEEKFEVLFSSKNKEIINNIPNFTEIIDKNNISFKSKESGAEINKQFTFETQPAKTQNLINLDSICEDSTTPQIQPIDINFLQATQAPKPIENMAFEPGHYNLISLSDEQIENNYKYFTTKEELVDEYNQLLLKGKSNLIIFPSSKAKDLYSELKKYNSDLGEQPKTVYVEKKVPEKEIVYVEKEVVKNAENKDSKVIDDLTIRPDFYYFFKYSNDQIASNYKYISSKEELQDEYNKFTEGQSTNAFVIPKTLTKYLNNELVKNNPDLVVVREKIVIKEKPSPKELHESDNCHVVYDPKNIIRAFNMKKLEFSKGCNLTYNFRKSKREYFFGHNVYICSSSSPQEPPSNTDKKQVKVLEIDNSKNSIFIPGVKQKEPEPIIKEVIREVYKERPKVFLEMLIDSSVNSMHIPGSPMCIVGELKRDPEPEPAPVKLRSAPPKKAIEPFECSNFTTSFISIYYLNQPYSKERGLIKKWNEYDYPEQQHSFHIDGEKKSEFAGMSQSESNYILQIRKWNLFNLPQSSFQQIIKGCKNAMKWNLINRIEKQRNDYDVNRSYFVLNQRRPPFEAYQTKFERKEKFEIKATKKINYRERIQKSQEEIEKMKKHLLSEVEKIDKREEESKAKVVNKKWKPSATSKSKSKSPIKKKEVVGEAKEEGKGGSGLKGVPRMSEKKKKKVVQEELPQQNYNFTIYTKTHGAQNVKTSSMK